MKEEARVQGTAGLLSTQYSVLPPMSIGALGGLAGSAAPTLL